MAGYVDPQSGQYIPDSFADELDLPDPGVNQGNVNKAKYNVVKNKLQTKGAATRAHGASARVTALQKQLKNKKLSHSAKGKLNAQLAVQKKLAATYESQRKQFVKQGATLQNKVYEASGQYDKLLTGENRDAYASLKSLFNSFGLGSLAPKIYEYAKQGYGADVISLLLQDTKEYKTRFAGNEARVKAGLPVLNPAEYLSTEQAYRQVMQDAGLPKGFYDSPTDFTNWIASDVSPTEIKGRVDLAVANTAMANPASKKALQDLYGVDSSYVAAYFLDNKKALPLLQKQSQAAQFGAEAIKRGLTLDKQDLEDYVTSGLSLSGVSQGFQAVAENLPNIQAIAARYGESFTQHELANDYILGDVSGTPNQLGYLGEAPGNKRKRLASQERALFSGSSGASPGGLAVGNQQT